jgi:TP901 family phage tail tape measure protein
VSDATRDATVRLGAEVDPYKREMGAAVQETDKLAASVDRLVQKLDGLSKRAGKKLMLFGAGGAAGVTALGVEAGRFERQLSTLNATAVITDKSFGKMRDQVKSITRDFPIARDEAVQLVNVMDKLGQTGGKNLRLVSESMVKLSAATGESLPGLTQQMVELQKQMGTINAGTMDVFANSLLQVSKNAGVSASGVLSFAAAIAPAARTAEMSQASVLGVSTAFTKAGADGFAAANTFNTMLTDITRQIATGSPEIAKYANLIGVTSEQFKRMDKGEALAAVFEQINKEGPNSIKTLDRLGYDGVRALRSIQAVSQSGGLRKAIAEATGAYSTTSALDSGSAAAMDGLYDELQRTKNMMQEVTTEAGQPMLKFLTMATSGFNDMAASVAPIAGYMGAAATAIGAFGSAGALLMGGAMAAGGLKATIAGVGMVAKSQTMQGIRGGYQVGQAQAMGTTPAAGTMGAAALARSTAREMRWWERPGYLAAQGFGQAMGGNQPGRLMNRAIAAPFQASRFVMNMQRDFYRQSRTDGFSRPAPVMGNVGNIARAAMPQNWGAFIQGIRSGAPASTKDLAGAMRDPEDFGRRVKEMNRATAMATTAQLANASAGRVLATQAGATAVTFMKLQAAGVRAAASLTMQAAGGVAKGAGGALYGLMGANPWVAGVGLAAAGAFAVRDIQKQGQVEAPESSPIDAYNAALGLSTSELGRFTDAVISATKALPVPKSMDATREVSDDVASLARMPERKLTNDIFENLKTTGSRAALMQLMGMEDPRQMQLVQADITQAQGRGKAQDATDTYFKRLDAEKGVNYGALVKDIDSEQGQGIKGFFGASNPTAAKMLEAVYGALEGQYGANAKQYNDKYATQLQVNETRELVGKALGKNLDVESSPLGPKTRGGRTAYQTVQGFEKSFLDGEKTGFQSASFANKTKGMTESEVADYFFNEFLAKNDNKKVAKAVKELRKEGVDFGGASTPELLQLRNTDPSAYRSGLMSQGAIGRVGLLNPTVQEAIKNPGDVNKQYQGILTLLDKAKETGKTAVQGPPTGLSELSEASVKSKTMGDTFAATDAELQKLKATIKDTSDPLYQLAQSAQQLNAQQRQAAMGYQGRVGRLDSSVANFRSVSAESADAPDHQERLNAARQELEGQKKSYYDYMVQIVQAQKNFAVQMRRSDEDMRLSIEYANQDFWRSMEHSEDDYYRSRARSQRDFNISMSQQTADFNLSMARNQEDFNRSLKRQAEDTASSIADPFARRRSEFTMSAASVIENMKNQNRMIDDQVENLRKLEGLGLSQKTIDMLKLADPANAQQAARIAEDAKANPNLVNKLNKRAARRQEVTEDLTQSDLSRDYRRMMADYRRGMERASEDFERAQQRAREANARTLADMAENYEIMTKRAVSAHERGLARQAEAYEKQTRRAKEDLVRMSEEVSGEFADVLVAASDLITANLGKMGDKVVSELEKLKSKFPELFKDLYSSTDPNVGTYSPPSARATEGRVKRNALGGIAVTPRLGLVAEEGPEAIIPLNSRGVAFMSGLLEQVTRNAVANMRTIPSTVRNGGGAGGMHVDARTQFSIGNLHVVADDPQAFTKKMNEEARFRKLTRGRGTGS